ncbi:MAG: helix-turn-helix domain-containing protein [Planctomycetota bacterium]
MNSVKRTPSRHTPWLTVEQTAAYLNVAVGTVHNWVSQRYVPFVRRGRVVRFHQETLDAWLRNGECGGRLARAEEIPAHK